MLLRRGIVSPTKGLGKYLKKDIFSHMIFPKLLDSKREVLYSRFLSAYAGRRKSFAGSFGEKARKALTDRRQIG
jgi:vacuolar-type H+-ATPase subunit D/Vma8